MHEKVKEFLENKKAEENAKKEQKLRELGLYEKVYSPDGNYSSEYSCTEWNINGEPEGYYKIVTCNVSDDEYEEILKYCNNIGVKKASMTSDNNISIIISAIAYFIYVVGFILGFVFGAEDWGYGGFTITLICWAIGFVVGTVYLGFAEIIKLLHSINNK